MAAGGGGYAGKPRPAVIVQDDRFDGTDSVTICAFSSDPTDAPWFRLEVMPDVANGLRSTSRLMVDKLTTVPRGRLGSPLGALSNEDLVRLDRAIVVFLGLAGRPPG